MLVNGFDSYLGYEIYTFLQSKMAVKGEKILIEKSFKSGRVSYYADFYLPEGCKALGIKPRTIIEAKTRLRPDTLYQLNQLFETIKKAGEEVHNFIVVYGDAGTFPANLLVRFKAYEQEGFFVQSRNEFCKGGETGTGSPAIPQSKQSAKDWKKRRDLLLEKARNSFVVSRHNTFFTGAGLGASIGMPAWDALLGGLLKSMKEVSHTAIDQEDYKLINDANNNSSLITGRYIEHGFKEDPELFQKHLHKVLYGNNLKQNRPLYDAIVRAVSTGGVEQVITFNFDDLLETALEENGIPVHSVFDRRPYSGPEFPVYHVHGMVPQTRLIGSTPVLSEKEYHMLYRESFHWSNVIQLQAFSRTTCFFVGLSMNDPNLRRLLDISRNGIDKGANPTDGEARHYAFLERKPLNPEELNYAKDEEHFALQEKMMKGLDINVIWYEHGQYDEIPKMIKHICKD